MFVLASMYIIMASSHGVHLCLSTGCTCPAECVCVHSSTTHQPVGIVLSGGLLKPHTAELLKAEVEAVRKVFWVDGHVLWRLRGPVGFGLNQHAAALLAARS